MQFKFVQESMPSMAIKVQRGLVSILSGNNFCDCHERMRRNIIHCSLMQVQLHSYLPLTKSYSYDYTKHNRYNIHNYKHDTSIASPH